MKQFLQNNIRPIALATIVISFFILSSWVSREYESILTESTFAKGFFGPLAYFILKVVDVIFAGFSSSPFIPLAKALWGTTATVLLSSAGWTTGSLIAFLLARRYGEKFVCRVINKCDLMNYDGRIKVKGLFWRLTLARVILPVDLVSYAIGLFSRMPWWSFALSTFIGSALFTYVAIFAAGLTVASQALSGLVLLGFLVLWLKKSHWSIFN
ncbi:MAG: VTT domain-containing protein [Candidatus Moranbacteria bacterium]|jgi:uncharacterized membrane protein YdjX (TVP38/TMEM64 family)|nr:VTT domain-containing protein [Candidatus Moranbacteria bacterium]